MFHQTDNLFFCRTADGDVRILKLRSSPNIPVFSDTIFPAHEVVLDVIVPMTHWCSIIATVSKTGEGHYDVITGKHKYYLVVDFHNS